jgi:predicted alpha/beta-fold hydrolase
MFDYACASDYYRFSSAGLYLTRINRPTLFLHAMNDPITPGHLIRMDNFRCSEHIASCMTQEGGHSMDWPEGCDGGAWAPGAVAEFLAAARDGWPAR